MENKIQVQPLTFCNEMEVVRGRTIISPPTHTEQRRPHLVLDQAFCKEPNETFFYKNCSEEREKIGRRILTKLLNFNDYQSAIDRKEKRILHDVESNHWLQHRQKIWDIEDLIRNHDPKLLQLLCKRNRDKKKVKVPTDLLMFRFCCVLQSYYMLPAELVKADKYLLCDAMLCFRFLMSYK